MKLIHYQLVNNATEFLGILKSSSYYKELLRYVCHQSSMSGQSPQEASPSNSITLIDWLEQRCAAIRAYACENLTSLVKTPEVKISVVKDKLYIHTQIPNSKDTYITQIQLISAINYQSFEEKKEFRLVQDAMLGSEADDLEDTAPAERGDVFLVRPEMFESISSKGFEILNQSKSVITFGVDFNEIVSTIVEKKRQAKERYSNLTSKPILLVSESDFDRLSEALAPKPQQKEPQGKMRVAEAVLGASPFEETLVHELVEYGGFSRVVAEKIVGAEGSLEKKTLHFSKVLKQIKDGLLDVKELEELRQAELAKLADNTQHGKKGKRAQQGRMEQRQTFARPEEKSEVLLFLRSSFLSYVGRREDDRDMNIEDFNDRHAYFAKVNTFSTD
jgi:hypothetical protein